MNRYLSSFLTLLVLGAPSFASADTSALRQERMQASFEKRALSRAAKWMGSAWSYDLKQCALIHTGRRGVRSVLVLSRSGNYVNYNYDELKGRLGLRCVHSPKCGYQDAKSARIPLKKASTFYSKIYRKDELNAIKAAHYFTVAKTICQRRNSALSRRRLADYKAAYERHVVFTQNGYALKEMKDLKSGLLADAKVRVFISPAGRDHSARRECSLSVDADIDPAGQGAESVGVDFRTAPRIVGARFERVTGGVKTALKFDVACKSTIRCMEWTVRKASGSGFIRKRANKLSFVIGEDHLFSAGPHKGKKLNAYVRRRVIQQLGRAAHVCGARFPGGKYDVTFRPRTLAPKTYRYKNPKSGVLNR